MALIPAAVTALLLGLGFLAGRYTVYRTFNTLIPRHERVLGGLLAGNKEAIKAIAQAYRDPDQAQKNMDAISWGVPTSPTPFVGSAPQPGTHGNARINSLQFRDTREPAMPKPPRTCRIFLTGGSAAYGSGAPTQETTIGALLERMLNDGLKPATGTTYEVFTFATPGWASTHERIAIENRLSELAPDLVISFSGNNDVHWGKLGCDVLWFRDYADDLFFGLVRKGFDYARLPEVPDTMLVEPSEIPPDMVARKLAKNIALAATALAQVDADYLFVLQPTITVTAKPLTEREQRVIPVVDGFLASQLSTPRMSVKEYFPACYARIDQRLRGLRMANLTYLNAAGVFDGITPPRDIFLDSYHYGDAGNELVARAIFAQVKGSRAAQKRR